MSWLKEEDALTLLKLYVDGLSFQQIGDRVGKDARVVEMWLARHNAFHITRKNKKEFTKEEMTKIEEINYLRLRLRELRNGDAAERLRLHRESARLVQSIPMPQRRLQELEKQEKGQKSSVPDGLNPILVERLDYIETEVLEGKTDEEIAEELGISYDEVAKFIGCYRLRPLPALPQLSRPDNVTPTEWVVVHLDKIKEWTKTGYKAVEIAKVLKVHRGFISLAQKGYYDNRND